MNSGLQGSLAGNADKQELVPEATDEPMVLISNLSVRYRGQAAYALQQLSLTVYRGEFVVIMGPNNAGKSTLAACLNGLVPHSFRGSFTGQVVVDKKSIAQYTVAQLAETVGLVFQDFEAQLFSTSADLEVAFGPENLCVSPEEIRERVEESLAFVGLSGYRHAAPANLSGGQKQKLAVASVLAMRPKVMVLDEPTTDLDPLSKTQVLEVISHMRERRDLTLILIEHETEKVLQADRILLLQDGQLLRSGAPQDVLQDVELLERSGIRPLGVTKFFHQMGVAEPPVTTEEAVRMFCANGWSLSLTRIRQLAHQEAQRAERYGPVVTRAEGLEHSYADGFRALRGVDLEVRRGEVLAIAGQNGSGKTTLVRHLNGLLFPTKGRLEVGGIPTEPQGVFTLGKRVGYVFQNPDHQLFADTVYDEVAFSLRLRNAPESEIHTRVTDTLKAVGLDGCEGEDPFGLTKSGRQRVAVAAVLAVKPDILILDEPTTGLDHSEQRGMMNLIKGLNEAGSTIIFVTHHMWTITEYAHRVVVMTDGKVLLAGSVREVFGQEAMLRQASLKAPQCVTFSNQLGHTLLTVEELIFCTDKVGQP